jgi:hypothetical protein
MQRSCDGEAFAVIRDMKRVFLMMSAAVILLMTSCVDVGYGDPLDRTGTEGGTLYLRDTPQ